MKKVLIITYYWPPSGGGGVQRWLKFAKYLPHSDWEPVIFTPENPDFNIKDHSLEKDIAPGLEVLKFPIWEPFQLFSRISGRNGSKNIQQGLVLEKEKRTWKDKLFIWIRGNLFVPDPRVFWVRPSVGFLKDYIQSGEINAIVTTGPPHSIHLIGYHLKKATGIPWLADFRDPWSEWDILPQLKVGKLAFKLHRRLEKKVLQNADAVATVSESWQKELEVIAQREVKVITNGFDETDYKATNLPKPEKFRITHTGLINKLRDPLLLWEALKELCQENADFEKDLEIRLVGILGEALVRRLQSDPVLGKKLAVDGYMPHHEVLREYDKAAVLLLILNQSENAAGHIPGKLFEYLAVAKPILALGPEDGDAAKIIRNSQAGLVCEFQKKLLIKEALLLLYQQYKSIDAYKNKPDVSQFSRRNLTQHLALILDKMTR